MRLSVTRAGWLIVCAQVLLLLVIAVFVKRTIDDTLAAAVRLGEPHDINVRLAHVKVALGVAEDALDVYIDDPSLARGVQYEAAVESTFAQLGEVKGFPEDRLTGQDLAAVTQTVQETVTAFAQIKALRQGAGLRSADTKTPLHAAYRRIDEVIEHENELARRLEASLDREVALLDGSLVVAGLVALLLQASVIVLIGRDQRRRTALQSALRSQNERLEATVAERTASLTNAKEELAWVSQRALLLQERERHHLALELHDQIGQQLAALGMILQHVERALGEASNPELRAHVRDGREVVKATYAQIHDIAVNLRPAMLDRLGLVPTLEWYARQQAQRGRCSINVRPGALPAALPTDMLTTTFRIAQEAVSNALRHAQPKRIEIDVGQTGASLQLTVRDDGAGFDVQATLAGDPAARSFGLLGMRERATSMGGTLSITSLPGAGTTITATLPLPDANAPGADPLAASGPVASEPTSSRPQPA